MTEKKRNDLNVEREIASFLNENLYKKPSLFTEFFRTDSKREQLLGCDLLLSIPNKGLNRVIVDEKVAANYANRDLNTFALEISFIGENGEEKDGWFIDKEKHTEFYLCGWIRKCDIPYNKEEKKFNTDLISKENIQIMDWALVSRKKLLNLLEEKGWTIEKIIKQKNIIRKNKCIKTNEFINGVSFRYSDYLAEKPINLLLYKAAYFKVSECCGIISGKHFNKP